jgi:hypothetical protein
MKSYTKPGQPFPIGPLWLIGMGLTAKRFKFCAKYTESGHLPDSLKNILME